MGGGSVSAREPTERPAQIFKFATYDIGHIAAEMEGRGLIDELNRMLLVQYFSAIEAYLSDRLIRRVFDDPKAMSALVKGNKEWVADKIEVVELASNPNAFRDWVHMRLRELMYHNFVKIDHYYRSALGSTIFSDEATKKTLMEFVPVRPDCVHRYGRDQDGRERAISKPDLERLSEALEGMVTHIEAAFARRGGWLRRAPCLFILRLSTGRCRCGCNGSMPLVKEQPGARYTLPLLAARLAGGLIAPASQEILYPAIRQALDAGGHEDIGKVSDLPGMPSAVLSALRSWWDAGIPRGIPDNLRLQDFTLLERRVRETLPRGALVPPDLVEAALKRLHLALRLVGPVTIHEVADVRSIEGRG